MAAPECIVLPEVESSARTDGIQTWHALSMESVAGTMVGGRLSALWTDQGWGNRKGHLFARARVGNGPAVGTWRRISSEVAPHSQEVVDITLPEDLFQYDPVLVFSESENVAGVTPDMVVSATYGSSTEPQDVKDVTDIVKTELAAGNLLRASNDIFGDPSPGDRKELIVKLLPDDAFLEFGFVVGGGGGHSLTVRQPCFYPVRPPLMLTASIEEVITVYNMGGEVVTTLEDVTEQEIKELRATKIRNAVQEAVGGKRNFRVTMPDGTQAIS